MNTDQAFNLYTATAEELAAQIEITERKRKDNAIAKLKRLSDLRWEILDEHRLMLNWIDFDHRGRTPEVIAAHKRYTAAQIAWLIANPGDDLTPEHVAFLLSIARKDLPHCAELKCAVDWVKEVEEYFPEVDPEAKRSETLRKLEAKLEAAINDVRYYLTDTLYFPDAELLAEINARGWRHKRRFRLMDTRDHAGRKVWQLRDIMIRAGGMFATFERTIGQAKTLAEVKSICRIWDAPIKTQIRDGATFVIGDGFEIVPQA